MCIGRTPCAWVIMAAPALFAIVVGGCGERPQEQSKKVSPPRPVAVAKLVKSDPSQALRITGVVEAWADTDIAFEVSGRIDYIAEQGTFLEGRWVEDGQVVIEGGVLATIERSPYEAALQAAQADVDYARVNLQSVLPAQLAEAQANKIKQDTEYSKLQQLHEKQSATEIELIETQAARDAADARVDQAKAQLDAGQASLAKAEAALVQAQLDLEHTRLAAPFTGEVAQVHVQAGGYVTPSQAVARLVTMDPVTVIVTVSADTHRLIRHNDTVQVYVPGHDEPLFGAIYQKSTVADPATRTFPVTIITRNIKIHDHPIDDPKIHELPRIKDVMPMTRPEINKPGPLWVEERLTLYEDSQGYFVWALEGVSMRDGIDFSDPVFTLRRVRVEPGDRRVNYQGLYFMRELKDAGGLQLFDAIAMGAPDGIKDGDKVTVMRESWLIQPGQLVDVRFKQAGTPQGYYVPPQAIMPAADGTGHIYVVTGTDSPTQTRKIKVTLGKTIGELQQIESDEFDHLDDDLWVVIEGVNYIVPGEPVRIIPSRTQLP